MLVATSDDAKVITHRNGKLLEFPTQQICRQHVTANLDFLKNFASAQFDGAVVGGIDCLRKPLEINLTFRVGLALRNSPQFPRNKTLPGFPCCSHTFPLVPLINGGYTRLPR
jgi:hypothetical protein